MKDMKIRKRTERQVDTAKAIAAMSQKHRDQILQRIVTPRRERRTT